MSEHSFYGTAKMRVDNQLCIHYLFLLDFKSYDSSISFNLSDKMDHIWLC